MQGTGDKACHVHSCKPSREPEAHAPFIIKVLDLGCKSGREVGGIEPVDVADTANTIQQPEHKQEHSSV